MRSATVVATPNGARGAVERREKAVAGVLHDAPLEAADFGVEDVVVTRAQLAPTAVAEPGGVPCRIDDVGEQHGGQHPVGRMLMPLPGEEFLDLAGDRLDVADGRPVVDALEFDDSRRRDSHGDLARVLDRDRFAFAVDDEGGHVNACQDIADIEVSQVALVGQERHRGAHGSSFERANGPAVHEVARQRRRGPIDRPSFARVVDRLADLVPEPDPPVPTG
jgi:hypothetical protein